MRLITLRSATFARFSEDLILDAIGKEGGLLIRAQVFEGEDCDAFRGSGGGRAGGWRRGILSRFRGNRREKDPIADGHRHRRKEKDREQGIPRGKGTQPNAGVGGAPSRGFAFELLGQRRVPDFIGVEVNNRNNYAVLHFAFAEIVQVRLPVPVLRQIFRHAFREKNVSGVAAIHHALGHVHASPGHVGPVVHIGHPTHGSAMDAHPHFEFRMIPQRLAGLHRASDWRIRSGGKRKRHSVSGRQPNQFSGRFRGAKSIGVADDLIELVQRLVLLINQQFRVPDNVDEQDVSDFEFEIGIEFRRHRAAAHRVRCEKTACFERKLLPRQSRLFLRFAGGEWPLDPAEPRGGAFSNRSSAKTIRREWIKRGNLQRRLAIVHGVPTRRVEHKRKALFENPHHICITQLNQAPRSAKPNSAPTRRVCRL